ncbi:hypothetical protein KUF71_019807 [Frankliniella fusca]|uniref:RNA-directed DNA polymerase n=1 Tax=Frankliniella fusca TaxID=407009 RepID=A0AAE1L7X5_9NEOP|nr:hypothetical protein KUF71_019807 [Frankliniella fusca]
MARTETRWGAVLDLEYEVTSMAKRPLLGREACHDFNLVVRVHHPVEVSVVTNTEARDEFVKANRDVFEGLGQFKQTIHLEVDDNKPAGMCPPRRYGISIAERLKTKTENVKFNPTKIQYKQGEVRFLGLLWSKNKIKIDPGRIEAIQALKPPQTRLMLQKVCGVFNHLRKFIPQMGTISAPLCELLSSATTFQWLPIEKEMLALTFAAEKMKSFIYGMPDVTFQTDHQPLVSIFKKPIHKITNNRLKKMRLKLMLFNPEVEYLPGKYMYLADLLSRNFIETPVEDDPEMVEVVHEVVSNLSISPGMMSQLKAETEKDAGLMAVTKYYQRGWPLSKKNIVPDSMPYWNLRNDLFVEDGLVILEDKVVVPPAIRAKVLTSLHAAHQGVEKTKARARQVVYWPGITNDIQTLVASCRVCERYSAANHKEPLIPHTIPELPYQKISVDILDFNSRPYLAVVDNFSKWLEIKPLGMSHSPSQILMSRMCRTVVPSRRQILVPKVVKLGAMQHNLQARVKSQHDKRARRKPVHFTVGDSIVYWRNRKWYKGTVVEKLSAPRSYVIRQLNGRTLRRNTWHLRKSTTKSDRFDEPPVEPYNLSTE